MSLVLQGATSGSITLQEPAVAGTTTINLPATSGTAVVGSSAVSAVGQIPFSTDGSTYTPTAKIVSGTSVASTSGTSIDFTSIPSWVKRITVMFSGVSGSGTSAFLIQLGTSSGIENTGYTSAVGSIQGTNATNIGTSTAGFRLLTAAVDTATYSGVVTIPTLGSNVWVCQTTLNQNNGLGHYGSGTKTTASTLDRVRITTVNGTDTFDAGTINILYE